MSLLHVIKPPKVKPTRGRVVRLKDDAEGDAIFSAPLTNSEKVRESRQQKASTAMKQMWAAKSSLDSVVVERGVPIPPPSSQKVYPWVRMDVGDSFLSECEQKDCQKVMRKMSDAARKWRGNEKSRAGMKFVFRWMLDEGGVRAWRTR